MGELELRNLTKVFEDDSGRILAVDDVTLQINDGEFVVFVGPSGCGKSTTLRCIAGLETVTAGEVVLDGEAITTLPPTERDIAMVFQNYALYPHMTAGENMAFGLKMSTDLSADEIERRVDQTAEMMGIETLLEKRPGELSGGQQQRVALGRAIVREPEVFLMDEPLSNLDAKLRNQMRTELQNLQHELDISTIYVTHDQTEAMTMGDRIAILNDGELQQVGTPLECYHEPANLFVAGFIGSPSMNFFSVRAEDGTLQHEAFTYEVSQTLRQEIGHAERNLVLGIRPGAIERPGQATEPTVVAPVSVVEPMGEISHLYVDIGDETYTVSQDGDILTEVGERVELYFPEDKIHLFDAETGEAIKSRTRTAAGPADTTRPVDSSDTGRS